MLTVKWACSKPTVQRSDRQMRACPWLKIHYIRYAMLCYVEIALLQFSDARIAKTPISCSDERQIAK